MCLDSAREQLRRKTHHWQLTDGQRSRETVQLTCVVATIYSPTNWRTTLNQTFGSQLQRTWLTAGAEVTISNSVGRMAPHSGRVGNESKMIMKRSVNTFAKSSGWHVTAEPTQEHVKEAAAQTGTLSADLRDKHHTSTEDGVRQKSEY